MLLRGSRQSDNVEDRRGASPGGLAVGGGLGGIVLLVIALLLGVDPRQLLNQAPSGDPRSATETNRPANASEEELKQFVSVVLADTEDVWTDVFRRSGKRYIEPKLVLFTDQVRSGCVLAGAAVGPFYCPSDQKVYIDLSFYKELKNRFRAPGDFAQAYVIAHEVGHHVQKLLGIMDQVDAVRQRVSERQGNAIQVRVELQADCFAGVWANKAQEAKNIFEPGDI